MLTLDYDYMCSETDFQLLKQRIVVKKIEQGERMKTYEKSKTDENMIQERRICISDICHFFYTSEIFGE